VLSLDVKRYNDSQRVGLKLAWEVRQLNDKSLLLEDRANLRAIGYRRPGVKADPPAKQPE
jgi:hypothetical protein